MRWCQPSTAGLFSILTSVRKAQSVPTSLPVSQPTPNAQCAAAYGQCAGTGWNGPYCCIDGYTCVATDAYYSQCDPSLPSPTPFPSSHRLVTPSPQGNPTPALTTPMSPVPSAQPALPPSQMPSLRPPHTPAHAPTLQPSHSPSRAPSQIDASTDGSCVPFPQSLNAKALRKTMLFISFCEIAVFCASVCATVLHFKAAAGRFSNVAWFHLFHIAFCCTYFIFHITAYYAQNGGATDWCLCDAFTIMPALYVFLLSVLWCIFIRYWKKALLSRGSREEWWQLRVFVYLVFSVGYFALYVKAISTRPCSKKNFKIRNQLAFAIWVYGGAAIVVCDSSILALTCIARLREQQNNRAGMRSRRAKWQTSLFVSLPVSMILACFAPLIYTSNGQEFFLLLPSTVMLFLMWGRRYISLADKNRDNLDGFWFENMDGTKFVALYGGGDTLKNPLLADEEDTEQDIASQHFAGHGVGNGRLYRASLPSNPSLAVRQGTAEKLCADFFSPCHFGSPLVSTIVCLGDPSSLVADEVLEPPTDSLVFTGLYLKAVILPKMELAFRIHLKRVGGLLEKASSPAAAAAATDSLFGQDLVVQRQQIKLEGECSDLTKQFSEFVLMVRTLAETMLNEKPTMSGGDGGGVGCGGAVDFSAAFKASHQKQILSMSHLATNLLVYSATFRPVGSSKATTRYSLDRAVDEDAEVLPSVSFGVPAAHAFGFADGGLRATLLKLEKEVLEASRGGERGNKLVRSPRASLRQLRLRFEVKARESVVMGQTLSGTVAASMDWLNRAVTERRGSHLKQVARVGLLLHSVSLLSSTSGHAEEEEEEDKEDAGMLDDFAGAYDDLELRLRFEFLPPGGGRGGGDGGARGTSRGAGGGLFSVSRVESTSDVPLPSDVPAHPGEATTPEDSSHGEEAMRVSDTSQENFLLAKFSSPTTSLGERLSDFSRAIPSFSSPASASASASSSSAATLAPPPIPTRRPSMTTDGSGRGASMGRVTVTLQVSTEADYNWIVEQLGSEFAEIRVVPVLFNLGVNETQAVASAAGNTDTQSQVNRTAATELRAYHSDLMKCHRPPSGGARAVNSERQAEEAAALQAQVSNLLDELDHMVEVEARERRSKNVDLLMTSCLIARLLNGVRTISCESGTDCTAMFQTLETARFAERCKMIDRDKVQFLLNSLRGEQGVRLKSCEVNTGSPKYSFNKLQIQNLPAELRPPLATTVVGLEA